jgi:hypothetical protein
MLALADPIQNWDDARNAALRQTEKQKDKEG